jgi:DNA processing protein
VPGRATAAVSAGTNALIRDGAALITSAADVIDELYGAGVRPASGGPDGAPPAPRPPRADTESTPDLPEDPLLREVLAAVEAGHGVDGVARAAGIEAPAARAALGRLEADGYITRSGLGSYERGAAMA